jgi:hypothetical protein
MGLKGEREKTTRTNVPTKECRPLVVEQEMGADSYLHDVSCSEILRNVALKKGSTSIFCFFLFRFTCLKYSFLEKRRREKWFYVQADKMGGGVGVYYRIGMSLVCCGGCRISIKVIIRL